MAAARESVAVKRGMTATTPKSSAATGTTSAVVARERVAAEMATSAMVCLLLQSFLSSHSSPKHF